MSWGSRGGSEICFDSYFLAPMYIDIIAIFCKVLPSDPTILTLPVSSKSPNPLQTLCPLWGVREEEHSFIWFPEVGKSYCFFKPILYHVQCYFRAFPEVVAIIMCSVHHLLAEVCHFCLNFYVVKFQFISNTKLNISSDLHICFPGLKI